ncbi:MAG: sigma factor [Agathobaculum sp.]|uniref:sigma factor n=1 Tax=Agathobaculum sp. TaxID=2048138 RepID=UPI003D94C8F2
MSIGEVISIDRLEELIEQYKAFLIRTVSEITGRYVSVEHDDEFSIALSAFAEAVERYQPERGAFLSFAKLVIQSRLRTYFARENRHANEVSLEALHENGQDFSAPERDEKADLLQEIHLFQEELAIFSLDLEVLADCAPKHQDTRERAIDIAERASESPEIVRETYRKKKLPVRRVSRFCDVTEKIVKGSRQFILAAMLIFFKNFSILLHWVKGGRCTRD